MVAAPQPAYTRRGKQGDTRIFDSPDRIRFRDFEYGLMRATFAGAHHCPHEYAAGKLRLPAGSSLTLDAAPRHRDLHSHTLIVCPECPENLTSAEALWREVRRDVWVDHQHLLVSMTLWFPQLRTVHLAVRAARSFAQEVADSHGVGVHLIAHAPALIGRPGDFHVHLLASARQLTPVGLGKFATGLLAPGAQTKMHENWIKLLASLPPRLRP